MAQTLDRAFSATVTRHPTRSIALTHKRLIHLHPLPSPLLSRRSLAPLPPSRFTTIRCRSGNSAYSPLNSGSNFSDRPPTEMAPLFPGCDYEHWLIVMDKPGGEGATKQQMIDCYIQTLAKVLGSEEEAKQKIYNVSCERYFGFGCEIDEETSNKLDGLPGVLFVLPDSYVDPENKDYGGLIKEVGSNSTGSSGNGFSMEVHAGCSTKCVAYGGNIPAMIEALDTIEDVDEALRPWKETLSNKETSIILKEQRSWERAMEIFERLKRKKCSELNVIHYTIMLRILGKARKWDHVEHLWDEMMTKGVVPSIATYGTLIDVYSKDDRVKEALLWLERMKEQGMEPNEVILGTVVQLYKKTGQFDKAEDFFKKWLSRASLRYKDDVATRNVCLTSRTYNILIDMYGKAGKLEEAFKTFSKMVDQGVKPTTVTLTTLIHIYGDHGELDVVTFLMQKMKELQCPPNTTTYNTLINMYGKAGKIEEASKKFSCMLKEGVVPTTLTFNTMMNICGEHGRLNATTFLMQKMKMFHCPPDTITYNILIKLHAKHDDINKATSYFRKMEEAGLEPDTVSYLTLLHAYSARHMVRNTEALIAKMDGRGVGGIDEFTQAALTRMYIETGMLDKSWKWFMRFHLVENMSSEWYSGIIDAYAGHGHIFEAEKVFTCCKEGKKLGVLVCNVMIKAYGIGNKCYEACQILDSMTSQGVVPDRSTYGSLIHILASAEMPHIATPYLRKMQEAGLVRDCAPYCAVILSFVKLGQLEYAEGLYKEMVGCNVQPDAMLCGVLIKALADVGRVKEAIHYVIAMGSAGLDIDTNEILIGLFSKLPTQETCEVLQLPEVGPE